jgi:phage-related protein
MLTLPANLIAEKNKMASLAPWLVLLEIEIPGSGTPLYIVRNTEDIVFNGHTYIAFPFELDSVKQIAKGQIPDTTLKVCNINQAMQSYLEEYSGLIGSTIVLKVVAKPVGDSSYTLAATFTYDVLNCTADPSWVTWSLGAPNPLFKRFPLYRFISGHCNWVGRFNTTINIECGFYDGGSTLCDGSLTRCRELNNSHRFGGFPGMARGNVRLV